MKLRGFLWALGLFLVLAPEIAAAQRSRPRNSEPDKGSLYYTTVIVSPDCIVYRTGAKDSGDRALGFLAGPLMSIVSPLISSGVDAITSRLKRIKEEFSASDAALGNGFFYRTDRSPMNYCITVVRGEFAAARDPNDMMRWTQSLSDLLQTPVDFADVSELGLAARPDLYAEFHIRYNEEPAAFEIVPMLIDYHKPLAKRTGSKGKLVSFGFRFDAVSSGEVDDIATFAAASLPGLRLFPNTVYGPDSLQAVTSGFHGAPQPDELTRPDGATISSSVPFNIIATVSEAEEPSILAEIVADSAVAIGANIKPALIGAVRGAVERDGR